MPDTYTIKRGATRPALRYSAGVDLIGATARFVMAERPGAVPVVDAPAEVAGEDLIYRWTATDTLTARAYYAEFRVTFPSGAVQVFPSDAYLAVEIMADLGGTTAEPIEPGATTGSGSAIEDGDTATGTGTAPITGIGAAVEGADTATGAGSVANVAPAVTTQPSITGNATTGSVLTLNEGAASGTPAPTGAIQWLRAGAAISGATSATYTLVSGDVGQAISARVTWTNSAGSVSATSNAITGQAPAAAQRAIILTDYAGDCDDAMALGVACAAHKRGDIHILGMVATSTIETSAAGVYGQLAAYGLQSIPVYAYKGSVGTYNNNISAPVRDAHGIPGQTRAAFEDDLTGLRRMLAASPDGSVKVIDIGAPISTARLLDSPADAISPMTGMQLVAAKVSGLWMMAGDFAGGTAEYNATRDIASTQRVYHDWPTPVYAHGAEVGGDVSTGPHRSFEMPGLDPIKTAFDAYGTAHRMSWDPIAVHHAVYGNGTLYRHAGEGGTITVGADGKTTWSATPAGNRVQVAKLAGQGTIATAIVNFVYGTDLIPINTQPQWAFPLDEGAGVVVEADTGAKGSIVNAVWAASPARLNFTSDHAIIPLRSADHDKDSVLGAVVRLGSVSGAQVIMSRTGMLAGNKFWQFRNNGGALEWVSFDAAGTGSVIASAAGALAANSWALVTAQVTDTTVSLRINGAEVKAGTFPARNKLLDPAVPVMVSGRSNTATWSAAPLDRMTSGDVAGLALRLASSDVAALEADLRAIATAKGIALP